MTSSDKLTDAIESLKSCVEEIKTLTNIYPEVHTYDGPNGSGYVIVLSEMRYGERYQRAINEGPEDRATDWEKK